MKNAIARGITLTLLILFLGCIGSAVYNARYYTPLTIENWEWQQATIKVYCNSAQIKEIRVGATKTLKRYLNLDTCNNTFVTVTLLGSPRYFQESEHLVLYPANELRLMIPHNMDIVHFSAYPR